MANKQASSTSAKGTVKEIVVAADLLGTEEDFMVEINLDDIADDFELSEAVAKYNLGEWSYTFTVLEKLLGSEAYQHIKDHCRLDNGRVSSKKVDLLCTEIMNQLNLKN